MIAMPWDVDVEAQILVAKSGISASRPFCLLANGSWRQHQSLLARFARVPI